MKVSNKTYDVLKFVALVVLPAVTVFVGATLEAINFAYCGAVVTIMTAFDTMLGSIVGKLNSDYRNEVENDD